MKRKTAMMEIIVLMLALALTAGFPGQWGNAAEINMSATGFNGDTYNASGVSSDSKWKITPAVATADASVTIVNKAKPNDPNNMALRMFTSSAAAVSPPPSPAIQTYFQTQFTKPLPGKLVTEFNVLRPDTNQDLALLQFRDNNAAPYKDYGGFIKFGADKKIYVYDSASLVEVGTYDQEIWTHVKIVMDPSANTYNLYINGEKKVPANGNSYFRNKVNFGVNSIYLVRFIVVNAERTLYLDDVKVYQLESPMVSSSIPENAAVNVARTTEGVELSFTNDMDFDTLTQSGNITINGSTDLVDSIRTNPLEPKKCTVKIKAPLFYSTTYQIDVQNAKDIFGNVLTDARSFTTAPAPRPLTVESLGYTQKQMVGDSEVQMPVTRMASGEITGSVAVSNSTQQPTVPAAMTMVLYRNTGTVYQAVAVAGASNPAIAAGTTAILSATLQNVPDGGDYFIKMYVWDSMENIMPYDNSAYFGEFGLSQGIS